MITIGLFGTCGNSTWRDGFIDRYNAEGISYYNPQVENWTPDCAKEEAEHLKNDDIILFPVLGETFGTASLAETGYSILSAISALSSHRFVIVYIEERLDKTLAYSNPTAAKESINSRKIVLAHLNNIKNPNVFIVRNMADMEDLSCYLWGVLTTLEELRTQYTSV